MTDFQAYLLLYIFMFFTLVVPSVVETSKVFKNMVAEIHEGKTNFVYSFVIGIFLVFLTVIAYIGLGFLFFSDYF